MAATTGKSATLSGRGDPRQLIISQVSAPYFEILGIRPVLGRTFAQGEDTAGNDHVVVLSHRIWTSQFGRDVTP
jgi:hypothetical protein